MNDYYVVGAIVDTEDLEKLPIVSAAQAILNGLSPDGGLYVPETIPAAPAAWPVAMQVPWTRMDAWALLSAEIILPAPIRLPQASEIMHW